MNVVNYRTLEINSRHTRLSFDISSLDILATHTITSYVHAHVLLPDPVDFSRTLPKSDPFLGGGRNRMCAWIRDEAGFYHGH